MLCTVHVHAQDAGAGPLTAPSGFYGTTLYGGTYSHGAVYRIDKTGHETVLYSFTGGADGGWPFASLITDSVGNLYGTTRGGGKNGVGTLFKLDPSGNETVIHHFGGSGVISPDSAVVRDSGGNLYGTTSSGGLYNHGVVYKIKANGEVTVLHSFTGGADGSSPAGVILDSAGNLYGVTQLGGSRRILSNGCGVVYKLDSSGNQTVLYAFTCFADGIGPNCTLTRDSAGNLYGTTNGGGKRHKGVVFRLDPSGNETVLYSFTGGADGAFPGSAGVVFDSAGNLYGTTVQGGKDFGVVYKIDTTGTESVLYSFTFSGTAGYPPNGVIVDAVGNIYGTTELGGVNGGGAVFKIGTGGYATVLHSFGAPSDGVAPVSGLILRR
jgi:uncharacterized repeat protein (TIGR03803 family)